ncbi:MAG: ATP-dependent DNA helicase RecG [Alphaproteobacteria bacterium]|nr:ATP-dependent DNA helicase RecG [Alphaproteobacteria bacterium]
MRPAILFPLFAEIRSLTGIGPKLERLIGRAAGTRLVDLIFSVPVGVIDRRYRPRIADAEPGRIATLTVEVVAHQPPRDRRQPFRVKCRDASGSFDLVFFHAHADFLARQLPPGETRVVSGRIEYFNGRAQMAHPDYVLTKDEAQTMPAIEPLYRLTEGLSQKVMGRAVRSACERVPELPEWLDPHFLRARGWTSFNQALSTLHSPRSEADLSPATPARARLAYDELLANQLALIMMRERQRGRKGRTVVGDGHLRSKALAALPFSLTPAQLAAIAEIDADMASPMRMLRLLQGDVGSGKTVMAMLALLNAVEAGMQGAFMAPTELLARQHMEALAAMAHAAGVRLALLTGRERSAARAAVLAALKDGEVDIVVGTHALFSEDVAFRDLGLAVIDEQHRFGVHQRMQLQGKGHAPVDVLVMTATPIPRTLALTAYGDMDVTRLTGRPPGRKPVDTRVLSAERLEDVITHLRQAIDRGARAYWVCPLIEESEKIDLAAAEARYAMLKEALGAGHVGLVHGRMKTAERDATMAAFKAGQIQVVVATTVIEVGVDVPEATIMVVEHAERFGLAQLHQLRGRVGRGSGKSTCLLIYHGPLGDIARQRLKVLRQSDDGFVIAEEDLRLRGAGELLGVRQSGIEEFRLAELGVHGELLAAARDDARLIFARDPQLKSPRGAALRVLLYLFGRDEAARYLTTG